MALRLFPAEAGCEHGKAGWSTWAMRKRDWARVKMCMAGSVRGTSTGYTRLFPHAVGTIICAHVHLPHPHRYTRSAGNSLRDSKYPRIHAVNSFNHSHIKMTLLNLLQDISSLSLRLCIHTTTINPFCPNINRNKGEKEGQ
jgi:hypothetical protein